jgi:hypothetical protein
MKHKTASAIASFYSNPSENLVLPFISVNSNKNLTIFNLLLISTTLKSAYNFFFIITFSYNTKKETQDINFIIKQIGNIK